MRRIKSHTVEKLTYFSKYIKAYLKATKRLPEKCYVDALVGTGKCILCDITQCKSEGGKKCIQCGKGEEVDGSALIALKIKDDFDQYILIDINNNNLIEAETHIKKEINSDKFKKIKFLNDDSNKILQQILKFVPSRAGLLVFADLEGSELDWKTLEILSKFKKAEIFILYAYDMSLVRLTKNYKDRLEKFYGDPDWYKIFKSAGTTERRKKDLLNFYINNIKEKLGFEHVEAKQIKTEIRGGRNLYHLILATHHPIGKKIIKSIFTVELDGQKRLKF